MQLVDLNVLLYAVNEEDAHHSPARQWLDRAVNGGETVGFAWAVSLGFLRLATLPAVFPNPLTTREALTVLEAWLGAATAVTVEPTGEHLTVLDRLLSDVGTGGNLVADAHLAALAIEHRARICSFDRDFARFAGVKVTVPE